MEPNYELVSGASADDGTVALILSVVSLLVSLAGFAWTIHTHITSIYPRLRVVVQAPMVFSADKSRLILIGIANPGPATVVVTGLHLRGNSKDRKASYFIPTGGPLDHPMNHQLPAKIEQGQSINLVLPYRADQFLRIAPRKVGVLDTLGRFHWSGKRDVRLSVANFAKDFPGPKN